MKPQFLYYLVIITAEVCQFEVRVVKRAIGGSNAELGQFPFIVSLRDNDFNRHICGASIISRRVLLTAAHCLCLHFNYTNLYAAAGFIFTNYKNLGTRYTLANSICHEKWNYTQEINTSINDIALALINGTIKYTENVKPIQLSYENVPAGVNITLIGYGCTSLLPNISMSPRLKFTELETISNKVCHKYYDYVDDRDMCTFNLKPLKGGCFGDSGTPVVYKNKQVGIHFNGDDSYPVINPDLHVRVKTFLPWIRKNIYILYLTAL